MKIKQFVLFGIFVLVNCLVFGRFGSADPDTAINSSYWIAAWSLCVLVAFLRGPGLLRIPWYGYFLVFIILGYGWFFVWNAKSDYVLSDLEFVKASTRLWKGGPGSVTEGASRLKMIEVSLLFLAFFAAARIRGWACWRMFLAVFPILGAAITLVGLFHRVVDAPAIWFIDQRHPPAFFAPFVYHANAGAFLNFAGAIGFAFWASSLGKGKKSSTISWGLVTIVCFGGVIATASKGAFLILAVMMPLCLVAYWKRLKLLFMGWRNDSSGPRFERKVMNVAVVFVFLAFFAVGLQDLIGRFDDFFADAADGKAETVEGRKGMMKVMLKMADPEEGGWWGFGPGSYASVVPYFLNDPEYFLPGKWENGHSDPLQLVVEWGYLGATFWILFGIGTMTRGFLVVRGRSDFGARPLERGMMIALMSMVLHSGFDFPFGILSLKFAAVFVCGLLWASSRDLQRNQEENH